MSNKIKIRRVVESEFPLLRKPTVQEISMIKNDKMFDIDGLFCWENEEVIDEDYSYCQIKIEFDGKEIFFMRGGNVRL